jgi:hypothetical protein
MLQKVITAMPVASHCGGSSREPRLHLSSVMQASPSPGSGGGVCDPTASPSTPRSAFIGRLRGVQNPDDRPPGGGVYHTVRSDRAV